MLTHKNHEQKVYLLKEYYINFMLTMSPFIWSKITIITIYSLKTVNIFVDTKMIFFQDSLNRKVQKKGFF